MSNKEKNKSRTAWFVMCFFLLIMVIGWLKMPNAQDRKKQIEIQDRVELKEWWVK